MLKRLSRYRYSSAVFLNKRSLRNDSLFSLQDSLISSTALHCRQTHTKESASASSAARPTLRSESLNRLLDAARGSFTRQQSSGKSVTGRLLKCFPLREQNFPTMLLYKEQQEHDSNSSTPPFLSTPNEFHELICSKIRNAKERIYLASLYIGPAANSTNVEPTHPEVNNNPQFCNKSSIIVSKEEELLDALKEASCKSYSSRVSVTIDDDATISSANGCIDIRIVLDKNRALRKVPINNPNKREDHLGQNDSTITSAAACFRALKFPILHDLDNVACKNGNKSSFREPQVYLFSVLPTWLEWMLPNPINEAAGVFHIKCYIIDNDLILSGANLSEEYFTDRTDRYLWISDDDKDVRKTMDKREAYSPTKNSEKKYHEDSMKRNVGTNLGSSSGHCSGLVQCYAEFIQALSMHADVYAEQSTTQSNIYDDNHEKNVLSTKNNKRKTLSSREELLQSLCEILTVPEGDNKAQLDNDDDPDVIAYAIPTIQFPKNYFNNNLKSNPIPSDVDVICHLIESNTNNYWNDNNKEQIIPLFLSGVRLSSSYLNPTAIFQNALKCTSYIHLLTAGQISHGFRPKKTQKHQTQPGNPQPKEFNAKLNSTRNDNNNQRSMLAKKKTPTDWIPRAFDALARNAIQNIRQIQKENNIVFENIDGTVPTTKLWFYQRKDWTFHAKGLWLTRHPIEFVRSKYNDDARHNHVDQNDVSQSPGTVSTSCCGLIETEMKYDLGSSSSLEIHDPSTIVAVTHGSSNYGARSEALDMESNLILIFPQPTDQHKHNPQFPLTEIRSKKIENCQAMFQREWNYICKHAVTSDQEETVPLSTIQRLALPFVRSFL